MGKRMTITPGASLSRNEVSPVEVDSSCYSSDAETMECLQTVVSSLLIKNQTMRFEIYSLHQRLTGIERLLFGGESSQLRSLIPSDILFDLHNLCQTVETGNRTL